MFIDQYEPNNSDGQAEYETAMSEYFLRKFDVKCAACGLEQTATESQLREIGWTLGKQELCFQACCIRDRCKHCGHGRNWHLVDGLWCGRNGCSDCGIVGFERQSIAMEAANVQ